MQPGVFFPGIFERAGIKKLIYQRKIVLMSVIRIPTTFNIDLEFEVPEFYRRLIALAIDFLVQFIYIKIASVLFSSLTGNMDHNEDSMYNMQAIGILLALPIFLYHIVLEISMNGQSIGKKIMGIRVVNENGGRPSIGQFVIRWLIRISDLWIVIAFIYFLSFVSNGPFDAESTFLLVAVLGFLITDVILVVSSKKNQRIGDILAKTILIRTANKANIEETVFQEVEETYVPQYPQIMQLSDRDINAIKNILESAKRKHDPELASAAAGKVISHLGIETSQDPISFLETLLKDYNYISTK
ncbi:MAG: RDD family protein [Chitinophagaceae bacterium]|nr:MAG: RDD family protein [Chitinophagaceae bacterium]